MCALTEKVIFTDPYMESSNNRWTTPQLDVYAAGIRNDTFLKLAVAQLKSKFISQTQALLHGDLHTGSVMATEGSTFVIDPEFAFYGPIGFDTGAFIANLFLNYFSHSKDEHAEFAEWILIQINLFYETFETIFTQLWNDSVTSDHHVGELYPLALYPSNVLLKSIQISYFKDLLIDTLKFAGVKMIRRIVGIAHVADLDSIADPDKRSVREKRALLFARQLILRTSQFVTINDVTQHARTFFDQQPETEWPVSE
jgi:5-methylthioribose kinase